MRALRVYVDTCVFCGAFDRELVLHYGNEEDINCVDMKHNGTAIVQAKLAGMSREQQLEYWRVRTDELLDFQRRVVRKQKAS